MSRRKVAIIGAGSWGTTIAKVIAENHPDVPIVMWAYEKNLPRAINERHENTQYLPGVALPPSITATNDIAAAVDDADAIIFGTPSKAIYPIAESMAGRVPPDAILGYLTKGFCKLHGRIYTISEALGIALPAFRERVVAIYGPSHAEEVCVRYHTCLNIAGRHREACEAFRELMACEYLECRVVDDILGVELGGTLKNPAAVAAGMLANLPRCGDNMAGALIAESFKEILRVARACGAKDETMFDISGLGDLITTALSDHSRNRRFGKDIALQLQKSGTTMRFYDRIIMRFRPDYIFDKMSRRLHYLAEGAYAIEPLLQLAAQKGVSIPVYRSLYEILINNRSPDLLIETVKKPEKFEELYRTSALRVTKRKKGLENTGGTTFRSIIARRVVERCAEDENLRRYILEYRTSFVRRYDRASASRRDILGRLFSVQEVWLMRALTEESLPRTAETLAKQYLGEFSDRFSLLAAVVFYLVIGLRNIPNRLLRRNYFKKMFRNNIRGSGDIARLRSVSDLANVIYLPVARSYFDFIYVTMILRRHSLPYPRFFVNGAVVTNAFRRMVLRLTGGYIVDFRRFVNPLYRETFRQYFLTLVDHGVPVLFCPELTVSKDGSIRELHEHFIRGIVGFIRKNAEEIALVPVGVSHFAKPAELLTSRSSGSLPLARILGNTIAVHFSGPIMLSEVAARENAVGLIAEMIRSSWARDSFVFAHYVFCRYLRDRGYSVAVRDGEDDLARYLSAAGERSGIAPRKIFKRGMQFCVRNGIATVSGGTLVVSARDEVDYYATLAPTLTA
ncbi:MAG TPA: NAD(P)H-dependent glycerol-3-phosphate dehydrogenase [Spirochaetota bacterium]|nr:NAD(P)H-dependent glycerol-3-phosphate dehydrogenase [Spirochaetota bacterium]HPU90016.1 NAD(P)H-dependent glycerol-3-phosphate dehydrogenase [Spirochaetota bacterium]